MSLIFWLTIAAVNGAQAAITHDPIVKAVGWFACGVITALAFAIHKEERETRETLRRIRNLKP